MQNLNFSITDPAVSNLKFDNSSIIAHCFFSALCTDFLNHGKTVRFRATGQSMYPTIMDGDMITVVPVTPVDVKKGDIVLYSSGRGIIAHRVAKIQKPMSLLSLPSLHSSLSLLHSAFRNRKSSMGRLIAHRFFLVRGDSPHTSSEIVEAKHVLGKVVMSERDGNIVDLTSRKSKLLNKIRSFASRTKLLILSPSQNVS
jgi:signal peptidase I